MESVVKEIDGGADGMLTLISKADHQLHERGGDPNDMPFTTKTIVDKLTDVASGMRSLLQSINAESKPEFEQALAKYKVFCNGLADIRPEYDDQLESLKQKNKIIGSQSRVD